MAPHTFVDTYNMIAFLTTSDASEGFDQIVDFLNAHMIQYALMVNPTIYVSCIKKFWTFVSIKKSNDIVRLQTLIDKKKVIITEDTIRQDLCLDDVAGIDCLPNEEIFAELARMGYEKPMVRNVDSPSMINAQVDDLSSHNTKYTSIALIQKVFANMRRIGKGFSGVNTPLFDGGCIQLGGWEIAELDADEDVTLVDAEEDMNTNVQGRLAESQAKVYNLDLQHAEKVLSMQDTDEAEPAKVEEVIEVVTAAKLITEVVTTTATNITTAQVPKGSAPRRKRGLVIQDLKETAIASVILHIEVKSKDKGKGILIEESKPLKRQAKIKQDEAFGRQLEAKLNANINWDEARKKMMIYLMNMVKFMMDLFKGMNYNDIRPIFEKHYNSIQDFLEKGKKEIEEEGSKIKGNSLNQDALKKQRINEEEQELKAHLVIIVNDDDDVFIEAAPLASKVNYQIHHENNKPYYNIIRADGTQKLFLSFITLLKNFNTKYLEKL
uniref:Xylulose kinase-1 n=1 Tax=Tanacetum cinerariifolium TaxID=118510 RepID=A0A6L2J222_TANCI|nr:hypothetical protein [Tanacetum cinerariifolium]